MKETTVEQLRAQGVEIPAPEAVHIGDEVVLERIVGPGTILLPGTRLGGARLLILPGCRLGEEGPVVVEDCALGPGVALKAGYAGGSVFLDKVSVGLGAQIRPGCLLEEQSSCAHTVGLKQTILLPFVTLGSLINFCDVLMAGGTSRQDHSEVGSSFIHFNFTPYGRHGDKATASLIGDVPRGVMLRSPRVFLGGQAGLVGPVQIGYGTVLAAGFVYRQDHGPHEMVVGEPLRTGTRPANPLRYTRIAERVGKNLQYIGNLAALWHWYAQVRARFARADLRRRELNQAAQGVIAAGIDERVKQLERLAGSMEDSIRQLEQDRERRGDEIARQRMFLGLWPDLKDALGRYASCGCEESADLRTLALGLDNGDPAQVPADYLRGIQGLDDDAAAAGTRWLEQIVARFVALGEALHSQG